MKNLIVIAIALIGLNAQASYMQETCSDAKGATFKSAGHSSSELAISKSEWADGQVQLIKIPLEYQDVELEFGDSETIHNESYTPCQDGKSHGVAWGKSVYYQTITITNVDGSSFDESIVGVSNDRKSVKAFLICERDFNSLVRCPIN